MLYNPLRKAMLLLTVAVILMFLVAAGIDTSSIQLAEVMSRSVVDAVSHYIGIMVLFSAWLITVGIMCRTLKKIPGIKSERSGSEKRSH